MIVISKSWQLTLDRLASCGPTAAAAVFFLFLPCISFFFALIDIVASPAAW